MARRKNGILSDGSDSESSASGQGEVEYNSQDDDDSRAERALFEHNGRKRRKTGGREAGESAWEGVFGEERDTGMSAGLGSARRAGMGGIGFVASSAEGRGGIGSSAAPPNPIAEPAPDDETPISVFGRRPLDDIHPHDVRPQRSFQGQQTPAPTVKPTDLTAKERQHFKNIQGSFGARMLSKLGWEAGQGLGGNKEGRAVPIEAGKAQSGKKGIQAGIRTEDSRREARRRGEIISDDEDDRPARNGRNGARAASNRVAPELDESWKKQKKVKVKVAHKTYEQLLAEAGEPASAGVGMIIDARGGELKEVQSLSSLSLSSWTPTSDSAQLPELRHNLRLIVDVSKADVDALAREGKSVNERRRWASREEEKARQRIDVLAKRIERLERIQSISSTISGIVTTQTSKSDPSLHPLAESFDSLIHGFKDEYSSLALDEIIIGAIGQVLRRSFAEWQPFDISSDLLLSSLKQWRKAYRLPRSDEDDAQALVANGGGDRHGNSIDSTSQEMTAWESLLWSLWLPKVRSAINNDWHAGAPQAAVHLLESWESILPKFIRDNVLDQLVLPKVKKAVDDWDRSSERAKGQSLAGIIFPWLPLLGERVEEILEGGKRRIRSVMRHWTVRDSVPEELARWKKDIYTSKEWDDLMLRSVVPKLGACLREDFAINPRKQDMVPLERWVMPWHTLLRASTFSQLIEVNFFPKWLDILYVWLIQPAYKPDEVANWYMWWKGRYPEAVLGMKGVSHGFNKGLELMNEAMRLGSDAPRKLRKPAFEPLSPSRLGSKSKPKAKPQLEAATDITFRSLAEDFAVQHDLIFLPVGRSHDRTGKPLFKVCKGVDGRGGVTVYVGENAVFAQIDDGSFRAVTLEDMVKRALT